ncbi:hypothetical protein HYS10_02105 [Candidatus Collierbacteria bacterium]|nr:hypothetical protein [Candidatus Collierbacteria bacterium]
MAKRAEHRDGGVNFEPGSVVHINGDVAGRDKIGSRGGMDPEMEIKYLKDDFTGKIGQELASRIAVKYKDLSLGQFYMMDTEDLVKDLDVSEKIADLILQAAIELVAGQ